MVYQSFPRLYGVSAQCSWLVVAKLLREGRPKRRVKPSLLRHVAWQNDRIISLKLRIVLQKLVHCSITAIWPEFEIVEIGKVMVESIISCTCKCTEVSMQFLQLFLEWNQALFTNAASANAIPMRHWAPMHLSYDSSPLHDACSSAKPGVTRILELTSITT